MYVCVCGLWLCVLNRHGFVYVGGARRSTALIYPCIPPTNTKQQHASTNPYSQVNGQALDPSQLALGRKLAQIVRECGAMALMLSLGLGLGLLQAAE